MLEPNFTPFPQLNTGRLLIRKITHADAPALLQLRSSETVMQYIDKERMKTLEEVITLIDHIEQEAMKGDGITWAVCMKEQPETLIGSIGLWRIIRQHFRAEIGYMLHPDFWGKGITKEALLAVIDFGFSQIKLHSIEAHINPENAASAALLESTGFVREAYFKEDFFFRGTFRDSAIYSLLNKS
jgi:[ribosomal protein S5]-alanine N-acetyltransferase